MMYLVMVFVRPTSGVPSDSHFYSLYSNPHSKVVSPTYRCTQLVGVHKIVGHTILVSEKPQQFGLKLL